MTFAESIFTGDYSASASISGAFTAGSPDSRPLSHSRQLGHTDLLPLGQVRRQRAGSRRGDVMNGRGGADLLRGRAGNDLLRGFAGDDRLFGEQGNDRLFGGSGNDFLSGGAGRNQLFGEAGQDELLGGKDADQLVGGSGDDVLNGNGGADRLTGGAGRDRFVLEKAGTLRNAAQITDFRDGEDLLELKSLQFTDINIVRGVGQQAGNTLIQNKQTGETLVILRGTRSSSIDAADFWSTSSPNPVNPTDPTNPTNPTNPAPAIPAVGSILTDPVKFSAKASEAEIAATKAARIQLGSQTIYIGTEQVTSINQNPVIVSFDAQNPANNWVRTDYEVTGADGRGYGLFWSGTQLYGVFTVDGTQGTAEQDFRRVSGGATQAWLRSYGVGGGPKVAVLARLNPATGEMTEAVYISAILNSGKSNSLMIENISVNAAGNLVVNAQSYFAPRRPDGKAMTQTTLGSSPFDYSLEITPDLRTVVSTAAVGWS